MDNTNEFRFKTNINCSGCIAVVKPHLDNTGGITGWSVDTGNKDKILTVKGGGITEEKVRETVQKAGFKAELLPA